MSKINNILAKTSCSVIDKSKVILFDETKSKSLANVLREKTFPFSVFYSLGKFLNAYYSAVFSLERPVVCIRKKISVIDACMIKSRIEYLREKSAKQRKSRAVSISTLNFKIKLDSRKNSTASIEYG